MGSLSLVVVNPIRIHPLLLVLLACFFGSANGYAQTRELPLQKMVLKQWTSDDGLISNNLTSVTQTSNGFMWVTTFNGFHFFDGRTFRLYDKDNVPALRTNAVYSMLEVPGQGLYFSTQGSGLLQFSEGQYRRVEALPALSVRKTMHDSKGRLWAITNNEGVFLLEDGKSRKLQHEALEAVAILDVMEDRLGNTWIGTEGNGLLIHRPDGVIQWEISTGRLLEAIVTTFLETAEGQVLVGTSAGLYSFDGERFRLFGGMDVQVNDLIQDRRGKIWAATERGIFRLDMTTGYSEHFYEEDGLPGNQISALVEDHEGSIWMATKKAGLVRMNTGAVVTLGTADGLAYPRVNVVAENNGTVFVGSDNGTVSLIQEENISLFRSLSQNAGASVRDFAFTFGVIWMASDMGLHRFEQGRERLITIDNGLNSNFIRRVFVASDGSLWLASRTGGVMQVDLQGELLRLVTYEDGLGSNYVLSVEEDIRGNIVAGTHSGGLSVITPDSVFSYKLEYNRGVLIFNIHVDNENRYWLSTNIGLYVFQNGQFRKVPFQANFKTETFFDFLPDREQNVWLSTNLGIVRVSAVQLVEFVAQQRSAVDAELFDHSDGMANRECTGSTRSTLMPSGEVWVPTIEGIATIDPLEIYHNMALPRVAVTQLLVDNEEVLATRPVVQPGKFRYEIAFASSSYIAPDKVKFRYQLSGVDKGWITTTASRVEYTNLSPGDYTFQVMASNNSDVWSREVASFSFVVQPFLYETWWFKALMAVVGIFVVYFIFVWRVRHVWAINRELRKLNEELDRFVYSASHDLRAPLTSILGLARIAKASPLPEDKDKCTDMIERSAEKLDGFISDIIDYSRNQRQEIVLQEIDVREELESVVEGIRYRDEKGRVECHISTSVKTMTTDVRRLRVVLKNILANAFIYHDYTKENPYVHVDCWEEGNKIAMSIADNGLGIKEESLPNIFKMFYRGHADSKGSGLGLYIAKENVEKIGGEIRVASKQGVGTAFTVMLPRL